MTSSVLSLFNLFRLTALKTTIHPENIALAVFHMRPIGFELHWRPVLGSRPGDEYEWYIWSSPFWILRNYLDRRKRHSGKYRQQNTGNFILIFLTIGKCMFWEIRCTGDFAPSNGTDGNPKVSDADYVRIDHKASRFPYQRNHWYDQHQFRWNAFMQRGSYIENDHQYRRDN